MKAKGGIFLRNSQLGSPKCPVPDPKPEELTSPNKQLPLPEKILSSPKKNKLKYLSTPKKVSLILKIENDITKHEVINSNSTNQNISTSSLPALKYPIKSHLTSSNISRFSSILDYLTWQIHDILYSHDNSPLHKSQAVEMTVMSQSYSTLPLPETSLTLQHCQALSRDSLQFATLSRRTRTRDTRDTNIRHSRTFSTFHPVPVPSVKLTNSWKLLMKYTDVKLTGPNIPLIDDIKVL